MDRLSGLASRAAEDRGLSAESRGLSVEQMTRVGTFLGTNTRSQTQPDATIRKRSRCFPQEKWSDRARRNQTQKSGENSKTGGCRFESCRACLPQIVHFERGLGSPSVGGCVHGAIRVHQSTIRGRSATYSGKPTPWVFHHDRTIRGIPHPVRRNPRLYSDPWPSVTIRSVHVFGHKRAIDDRLQATLPGISPTAPPGDLVYRLKPMAILTALRSPEGIDAMVLGVEGEEIRMTLDALLPVLEDRTVAQFEMPVARSP